jgi:hypothetical protein
MKGYQVMMFLVMVALSLALVPAAQANCAWVLWSKDKTTIMRGKYLGDYWPKKDDWKVIRVFSSKAECETRGKSIVQFMRDVQWKSLEGTIQQSIGGDAGIIIKTNEDYQMKYEFLCTPDTVDPRDQATR